MSKFAIRLKGTGCLVPVERKLLGFWRKIQLENKGFFATRFIDAPSADEAIRIVTANVREEIKNVVSNKADESWTISVDEIWEDPEQYDRYAPGSGVTWFSEAGSGVIH